MFSNVKPKTVENKSEAKPTVNGHKDSDDDDDEIISKKSAKKRGRIIDDDEDENVSKQMKADILDSDNESEKENGKCLHFFIEYIFCNCWLYCFSNFGRWRVRKWKRKQ